MIRYDHLPVPVHLFVETRHNSRISLLENRIHVRLPRHLSAGDRARELNQLLDWAKRRIERKEMYRAADDHPNYFADRTLRLMGEEWCIRWVPDISVNGFNTETDASARELMLTGNPSAFPGGEARKAARDLIVKSLIPVFREPMFNSLSSINDKTLAENYNEVRLKNLKSRWGSCSVRRNINLSARLLLVPEDVREYVMIHELAHLQQMNHSVNFWNIVARHLPEYKVQERWLRENGHHYDF